MFLSGQVTGRGTRVTWSFGDGSILTNANYLIVSHAWTNPGDYTVAFTAFNSDNPSGVSTNLLIHVLPLVLPSVSTMGLNGTNFTMSFPTQPGVTYVVQKTGDLTPPANWQIVTSLLATNSSLMQITDRTATNSTRFYRVELQ